MTRAHALHRARMALADVRRVEEQDLRLFDAAGLPAGVESCRARIADLDAAARVLGDMLGAEAAAEVDGAGR